MLLFLLSRNHKTRLFELVGALLRLQYAIWTLLFVQLLLYGDPDEFYDSSASTSSPTFFQVEKIKQQHLKLPTSVSELKTKLSREQLSDSLNELWGRVQAEASEYKITPDEALMRSSKLNICFRPNVI